MKSNLNELNVFYLKLMLVKRKKTIWLYSCLMLFVPSKSFCAAPTDRGLASLFGAWEIWANITSRSTVSVRAEVKSDGFKMAWLLAWFVGLMFEVVCLLFFVWLHLGYHEFGPKLWSTVSCSWFWYRVAGASTKFVTPLLLPRVRSRLSMAFDLASTASCPKLGAVVQSLS